MSQKLTFHEAVATGWGAFGGKDAKLWTQVLKDDFDFHLYLEPAGKHIKLTGAKAFNEFVDWCYNDAAMPDPTKFKVLLNEVCEEQRTLFLVGTFDDKRFRPMVMTFNFEDTPDFGYQIKGAYYHWYFDSGDNMPPGVVEELASLPA
eukprot:GEMP01030350.1.p1 GENE.GEMP01030350.1~~GEMP01030350.1.p1  ORF type:complete len:147 (-),score=38.77 GEMP01030350.1:1750-2190(-)